MFRPDRRVLCLDFTKADKPTEIVKTCGKLFHSERSSWTGVASHK